MHVKIKRVAVATVLCGGVAALAFGGEAVSTAYTQSSTSTASVDAATVGTVETGDLTLTGALPGDATSSVNVGYDNTHGTYNEHLVLATSNASGDLSPSYIDVVINHTVVGTLAQISGGYDFGVVNSGSKLEYPVQLELDPATPDAAFSGKSYSIQYTLTATPQR